MHADLVGAPGQRTHVVEPPLAGGIGKCGQQPHIRDRVDLPRVLAGLQLPLGFVDPRFHAHRVDSHPIIERSHRPIRLGHRTLFEHLVEHPAILSPLAQQQDPTGGAIQPVQCGNLIVGELHPPGHHRAAAHILALGCAAQPVGLVHGDDPLILVEHVQGDGSSVVVGNGPVEPHGRARRVRRGGGDHGGVVEDNAAGRDLVREPRGAVGESLHHV